MVRPTCTNPCGREDGQEKVDWVNVTRESWGPAIFSGDLSKRERGDQVRGERERGDREGIPKGWYLQGTNQYRLRGR